VRAAADALREAALLRVIDREPPHRPRADTPSSVEAFPRSILAGSGGSSDSLV
jgi:hypothetical protein